MEKVAFIRELCTDKFEGIPCNYPACTCSPENREEMEAVATTAAQFKGEWRDDN